MSNDVGDFLFGGGAKSFPFNEVGDSVRGEIVSAELRQQTSMDGELLSWPDGRPRMQLVITLQTDLREGDNDDGKRTIYAKGGNFDVAQGEGDSMRNAIAEAVKTVGATSLDPGDELVVMYSGKGVAKRGYSAPKLYTAGFRKARKSSVKATDLFGDDQPTPLETGV